MEREGLVKGFQHSIQHCSTLMTSTCCTELTSVLNYFEVVHQRRVFVVVPVYKRESEIVCFRVFCCSGQISTTA